MRGGEAFALQWDSIGAAAWLLSLVVRRKRVWLRRALGYNPYDQAVHRGLQRACEALDDKPCAVRAGDALTVLQAGGHDDEAGRGEP